MAKRDLFSLQQHLVVRTANYFRRLGDLASQGSIEPREYIEESFNLWSGALAEVGDWLKPRSEFDRGPGFHPFRTFDYEMRSERGDFRFSVPVEVFERYGEDAVVRLSIDGMVRTFDPNVPLKSPIILAPEQNVRVDPPQVTRDRRDDPELKVYAISSMVLPQEQYEGVVWGALEADAEKRFPVAVIQLTIV